MARRSMSSLDSRCPASGRGVTRWWQVRWRSSSNAELTRRRRHRSRSVAARRRSVHRPTINRLPDVVTAAADEDKDDETVDAVRHGLVEWCKSESIHGDL